MAFQKMDSGSSQGDQEKIKELDRALGDFNYLVAFFSASYTPLQISKSDLCGLILLLP